MKNRRIVAAWKAARGAVAGTALCLAIASSGQQTLPQVDVASRPSSGSVVENLSTAGASVPGEPNAAPVSEVTTTTATPASYPSASPSPAAPVTPVVAPKSPPKAVCPDPNWVLQEGKTHLPLTGDLYIKGLSSSITADINTDARVVVKVGNRITKEVIVEAGRPTRLTFDSQDGYWQESGVLLPVALSVKSPADWPADCRLLNFTVSVALSKVHFAVSGGPEALGCENPCEVVGPRKSRAVWGEKVGFEVSLKQASGDARLPGDVTIGLEGDEVTGKLAYSLPGYSLLKNLHFEIVPRWRFFAVSPRPLAVRLDVGLGTDAATGKPLQGFSTPLTLESVPPWWVRLPIWFLGALLWTVISMSPLVRRPGVPRMGGWRVAGALVSAALIFSCVEAGASSLPKAVEDVPYSLWGSFLLGFATAMAGVTLVMKYVGKTVTGGVLDIEIEDSPPTGSEQRTAVTPLKSSAANEHERPSPTPPPAANAFEARVADLPPIENRSRLFICLHEAGHCLTAYEYGGHVESIDFPKTGDPHASVVRPPAVSKHIACGGFAVEYLLFKAQKIVDGARKRISEKEFVSTAMTNAERDKRSFFNGDFVESDGKWPAHMDNQFMSHAINEVVPRLQGREAALIRIARELDGKGYLTKVEIEAVVLPL